MCASLLDDRTTSHEIFERIILDADEEMSRGKRELFFSSLAAGLAITATFYFYVTMTASFGNDSILKAILYPIGFIFIILGNYQLFTENTLPPVALVIERMASVPALIYMWTLVLVGNISGVILGTSVLAFGDVFTAKEIDAAIKMGRKGIETDIVPTFIKGMIAGLVVAGVVWLDFSFKESVPRLLLVYIAFISIPLSGLFHIVVSTAEVFFLTFSSEIALWTATTRFLFPVICGNIIGGVVLVTIVNYFQTPSYIQTNPEYRLKMRKWLFSFDTGRTREEIYGEESEK